MMRLFFSLIFFRWDLVMEVKSDDMMKFISSLQQLLAQGDHDD